MDRCNLCWQKDGSCEDCREAASKAKYGFKPIRNIKTGIPPQAPIIVYLAIPYTWNPKKSFEIANKVAADLMNKGYIVFSPISHSHPIADYLAPELRTDSNWWLVQDFSFIEHWADEVHVICIGENGLDLIENSTGVTGEWKKSIQCTKPIKIIEYYE